MAISNMKVTFQTDIQKVWDTVTSLEKYAWRSDLSKIEILNENSLLSIQMMVTQQLLL